MAEWQNDGKSGKGRKQPDNFHFVHTALVVLWERYVVKIGGSLSAWDLIMNGTHLLGSISTVSVLSTISLLYYNLCPFMALFIMTL